MQNSFYRILKSLKSIISRFLNVVKIILKPFFKYMENTVEIEFFEKGLRLQISNYDFINIFYIKFFSCRQKTSSDLLCVWKSSIKVWVPFYDPQDDTSGVYIILFHRLKRSMQCENKLTQISYNDPKLDYFWTYTFSRWILKLRDFELMVHTDVRLLRLMQIKWIHSKWNEISRLYLKALIKSSKLRFYYS